jgi:hypothetical protein
MHEKNLPIIRAGLLGLASVHFLAAKKPERLFRFGLLRLLGENERDDDVHHDLCLVKSMRYQNTGFSGMIP